MTNRTTLDARINEMKPGQEIEISQTTIARCTAERSGNGAWLRFVRHTADGFEVFRLVRF